MNPATPQSNRGPQLPPAPLWLGISRGIAAFFGALCLLDALRAVVTHQTQSDFGWIDLSPCPIEGARGLLAFCGVTLILFAVTHRLPHAVRPSVIVGVMALVAAAVGNAVSIHRAIRQGEIPDGIPMPAHLVSLLVPVVFGVVRGGKYGRLRFPLGSAVVATSFVAAGFAFSVGYMSSLSKFHRPQIADAIVLLPSGTANAGDTGETSRARQFLEAGFARRLVIVNPTTDDPDSATLSRIRRALPETEVVAVSAVDDRQLAAVLAQQDSQRLLFIGSRHDAPRTHLIGQQISRQVAYVPDTGQPSDKSLMDDVGQLWQTWLSPLANRAQPQTQQNVSSTAARN